MEISGGTGGLTMASPSGCSNLGIQESEKIEYGVTKKHCRKIPVTVIVHKYVPLEDPQRSSIIPFKGGNKAVYIPAIAFIFLPEKDPQLIFFPFDTIDHIEIIEHRKSKDYPYISGEEQKPQQYKKTAQIHGVSRQPVEPLICEHPVFFKRSKAPHLNQFPEQGDNKSGPKP